MQPQIYRGGCAVERGVGAAGQSCCGDEAVLGCPSPIYDRAAHPPRAAHRAGCVPSKRGMIGCGGCTGHGARRWASLQAALQNISFDETQVRCGSLGLALTGLGACHGGVVGARESGVWFLRHGWALGACGARGFGARSGSAVHVVRAYQINRLGWVSLDRLDHHLSQQQRQRLHTRQCAQRCSPLSNMAAEGQLGTPDPRSCAEDNGEQGGMQQHGYTTHGDRALTDGRTEGRGDGTHMRTTAWHCRPPPFPQGSSCGPFEGPVAGLQRSR
jgi:hypothetical protein